MARKQSAKRPTPGQANLLAWMTPNRVNALPTPDSLSEADSDTIHITGPRESHKSTAQGRKASHNDSKEPQPYKSRPALSQKVSIASSSTVNQVLVPSQTPIEERPVKRRRLLCVEIPAPRPRTNPSATKARPRRLTSPTLLNLPTPEPPMSASQTIPEPISGTRRRTQRAVAKKVYREPPMEDTTSQEASSAHSSDYDEAIQSDDDDEDGDDDDAYSRSASESAESPSVQHSDMDFGFAESDLDVKKKKKKTPKANQTVRLHTAREATDKLPANNLQQPKERATKNLMHKIYETKKELKGINLDLPPLFDNDAIFADLTEKAAAKGLGDLVRALGSRPLRVATMCSGTESPLLALEKIKDSLRATGYPDLVIDHVFSAEIEPYKQAFIERNFQPPIILRDIVEITHSKDGKATTAYGARIPIPDNVDLVIAGTACVDFSGLNRSKKGLEDDGESADTFTAVLDYAKKYKPRMLILENVFGAPWDTMLKRYDQAGYSASGVLVDTKDYYLPQTRQRGYMFCVHRQHKAAPKVADAWWALMKHFKRQVSSPVSDFLLPNNHDEVIRSRDRLARQALLDARDNEVDWSMCEIRHIKFRRNEGIGNARPYTGWESSGTLELYDYADKAWHRRQVERVWDFEDCSLLRKALPKAGQYDIQFKTRVWDVSQNIDRYTDTAPFGVSSCLTPSGNFFVTDRGGPLTFTESLILQGIPISKINITTETERQVQDLAGNAMSATVVGSAIAAALVAGKDLISDALAARTPREAKKELSPDLLTASCSDSSWEKKILQPENIEINLDEMILHAAASSAKCYCEGETGMAENPIQSCRDCGHTTCLTCGKKPIHNYTRLGYTLSSPESFIERWQPSFPMRLHLKDTANISALLYEHLTPSKEHKDFCTAVEKAVGATFTFSRFKRSRVWIVTYEAPSARLDFVIDPKGCEWRLSVKPDDHLAGNNPLRTFMQRPVARSSVDEDNFLGRQWEWRVPHALSFGLSIDGDSEAPSWGARLNIPALKEQTIFQRINIKVDNEDMQYLSGTYRHLPHCGTASESLYKRVSNGDEMYLFLDPTRIGDPSKDQFVFSSNPYRLQYGEHRDSPACITASWRPWSTGCNYHSPGGTTDHQWISVGCKVALHTKRTVLNVDVNSAPHLELFERASCSKALPLIACTFPVDGDAANIRRLLDSAHIRSDNQAFFSEFAWALGRLGREIGSVDDQTLPLEDTICEDCAPVLPEIKWAVFKVQGKDEIRPYEDSLSANRYETSLKKRPSLFLVSASSGGSQGRVQIALNVRSLGHRALAKLKKLSYDASPHVVWSLNTAYSTTSTKSLVEFRLSGNEGDVRYEKKVSKLTLWPKQQQSLGWMRSQETGPGCEFVLEAVEEAILPHIGWRAEARASSAIHIRGGILADHPGFGKTITSLSLINAEYLDYGEKPQRIIDNMKPLPAASEKASPLKIAATLILCPETLIKQWRDEIKHVLGEKYDKTTIVVETVTDLMKLRVASFQSARIILLNPSILSRDSYVERIATFAGVPDSGSKRKRGFKFWLDHAIQEVRAHVNLLRTAGTKALEKRLKQKLKSSQEDSLGSFARMRGLKRLKGSKYAAERLARQAQGPSEADVIEEAIREANEAIEPPKGQWLEKCVLFEMFHYNRIIVDEFAYDLNAGGGRMTSIAALSADKRWALSATPPLKDPYDVSRIARILGINLPNGANIPGVLSAKNLEAIREDMTNVELVENLREAPSNLLHSRVHALAQRFLDTFVRQNILKLDDSPYQDCLIPINLSLDHRIVYTELSQRLNSQDMTIKKLKTALAQGQDHELQILKALHGAATPEEALLKRAVIFSPGDEFKNGKTGLDALLQKRRQERSDFADELRNSIFVSQEMHTKLREKTLPFQNWKDGVLATNELGDQQATDAIKAMVADAEKQFPDSHKAAPKSKKGGKKSELEEEDDGSGETAATEQKVTKDSPLDKMTKQTSKMNQIAKRYVSTGRTIRFVENTCRLQQVRKHNGEEKCDFQGCNSAASISDLAVSSLCGHTVCRSCLQVSKEGLGNCEAHGCKSPMRGFHLLWSHKMGDVDDSAHGEGYDGRKILAVLELLEDVQKHGDQAILFVRYEEQLQDVGEILTKNNISCVVINKDKAGRIEDFKSDRNPKTRKTAIVLNASDASAAGTNLTNANHVIFLSPLLSADQYSYDSQMAQAIGRIRRPGQTKKMFVYRMVALDTIDVDVLEHRERSKRILMEKSANMWAWKKSDYDSDEETGNANDNDDVDMQDTTTAPFTVEETSESVERTQLIRDSDGKIKLVPKSLLLRRAEAEGTIGIEGRNRVKGFEDFSSLVKFSKAYSDDE